MNYNYLEEVKADVENYVRDEINLEIWEDDRELLEQKLNDDLFCEDVATGNASGSYYCNAYKAEEALAHNWDLLAEAMEEYGYSAADMLRQGPEACDVVIRCYLLPQAISEVLDDLFEEMEYEEETMKEVI